MILLVDLVKGEMFWEVLVSLWCFFLRVVCLWVSLEWVLVRVWVF